MTLTRARKAVREDAVHASSPAPAKTSKGKATSPTPAKSDELDISSICWMELHNERNGKDVILTYLVLSEVTDWIIVCHFLLHQHQGHVSSAEIGNVAS